MPGSRIGWPLVVLLLGGAVATPRSLAQPAPGETTSPCDAKRDGCRASCFDRFASRDEDAYAKCKEACNRDWLACSAAKR
jgi:hypothetical protein